MKVARTSWRERMAHRRARRARAAERNRDAAALKIPPRRRRKRSIIWLIVDFLMAPFG
jgi:hypothetical protein